MEKNVTERSPVDKTFLASSKCAKIASKHEEQFYKEAMPVWKN